MAAPSPRRAAAPTPDAPDRSASMASLASQDTRHELATKAAALKGLLKGLERVAVACSGGVDSTYLLSAAVDALGADNVLAVTVASELTPRDEVVQAKMVAARLGARHAVIPLAALDLPGIQANPADRCYHCKRAVLEAVQGEARQHGIVHVIHGANRDDRGEYRPGSRAALELGVRAPLDEAGLSKAEIRVLSQRRGLPNWDRPAQACLATRFPYGTPLTLEALRRVEGAEAYVRQRFGLREVRVRDHFPVARIEVPPPEWPALVSEEGRHTLLEGLRRLGYVYVTLDLAGLRSGSMDDALRSS